MYLNLLKQPTIRNGGNNMNSLQFGTEVIWIYHVQSSRESSKHHIKLCIAATIQFQILCIVIWTNLYHLRLCLDTSNLPGQRHGDWAHVTSKSRPPNGWQKWTNITYTSYKKNIVCLALTPEASEHGSWLFAPPIQTYWKLKDYSSQSFCDGSSYW